MRPQLALAFPFEPACRDTLLVIGQAERHYVIGVIESTGTTHLSFKGDVELRAAGGTLELEGEKGVRVDGPSIAMRTRKLSVVAGKVTEVFGTAFTRVKELLSVRSAKTETLVHGEWSQRAERAAITSEEAVAINGKQIHLG